MVFITDGASTPTITDTHVLRRYKANIGIHPSREICESDGNVFLIPSAPTLATLHDAN